MKDLEKELKEKKEKLLELVKSRSKASCSSVVSSNIDVRRETEIEDLEDEIESLQKQLQKA